MALKHFDHVNVRTNRLEAMIAWYGEVLGLKTGARPPFSFPGAWLYLGDQPIIHLVGVTDPTDAKAPSLEHFALRAEGLGEFLQHLKSRKIEHKVGIVPGFGIIQVNVWDPQGNHIHIDFGPEEKAALETA